MGPAHVHSYGPQPILDLAGIGGQALEAYENGRDGIAIHGGDVDSDGHLRPTYGCLRVDNETQVKLLASLAETGIGNAHVIVSEI